MCGTEGREEEETFFGGETKKKEKMGGRRKRAECSERLDGRGCCGEQGEKKVALLEGRDKRDSERILIKYIEVTEQK
jgi:hypothetical protein